MRKLLIDAEAGRARKVASGSGCGGGTFARPGARGRGNVSAMPTGPSWPRSREPRRGPASRARVPSRPGPCSAPSDAPGPGSSTRLQAIRGRKLTLLGPPCPGPPHLCEAALGIMDACEASDTRHVPLRPGGHCDPSRAKRRAWAVGAAHAKADHPATIRGDVVRVGRERRQDAGPRLRAPRAARGRAHGGMLGIPGASPIGPVRERGAADPRHAHPRLPAVPRLEPGGSMPGDGPPCTHVMPTGRREGGACRPRAL